MKCLNCNKTIDVHYQTYWMCSSCGSKYSCVQGIPVICNEDMIGSNDRKLRDHIYNSSIGRVYNFIMPLLLLPVRPFRSSISHWLLYSAVLILFGVSIFSTLQWILSGKLVPGANHYYIFTGLLVLIIFVFIKKPNYLALLLLAIPVKIILSSKKFKPEKSHAEVHRSFQDEFLNSDETLQVLDVATGTCNSLYRHGWMKLSAEYTGVDISEKMILKGRELMTRQSVPVDFVISDATQLPFHTDSFDIVTSYGAINAYSDPETALREMVRVTRPGGKILFLDEQEYSSSSWLEHMYFRYVLTFHNTIVDCPVQLLPSSLEDIEVHQVYEFIYICTARKKAKMENV